MNIECPLPVPDGTSFPQGGQEMAVPSMHRRVLPDLWGEGGRRPDRGLAFVWDSSFTRILPKNCVILLISALLVFLVTGCGLKPAGVFEPGVAPVVVAEGFNFTEGPTVGPDGSLYFTEYRDGAIFRLSPGGRLSLYHEIDCWPLGLSVKPDGSIAVCANKWHRIVSVAPDGTVTRHPDRYRGKLLNSPNDCWADARGGIYFTDPRFVKLPEPIEQDGYHVYYIPPDGRTVIRAVDTLSMPNGVVGSPDGSHVYVIDNKPQETWRFTVRADGSLADGEVFAPEGEDGLAVDDRGNVYIITGYGVAVYSPEGKKLDAIDIKGRPTNVAVGGPDGRTLYITARKTVLAMRIR